jgi:hypothetical protein
MTPFYPNGILVVLVLTLVVLRVYNMFIRKD